MAYGDIIGNSHKNGVNYREKNGVETINRAVVIKDGSTKGSAAIDFTSNHLNLGDLTDVKASNRAALYIGTAGDVCVLLSGESDPIAKGTADGNTANKLVDSTANFNLTGGGNTGDDFVSDTITDTGYTYTPRGFSATQP